MMTSFETNNSTTLNHPTVEDASLSAHSSSSEESAHSPSPPALQDSENEERPYNVTPYKYLCGNEEMQIVTRASQLPHPRQTTENNEGTVL